MPCHRACFLTARSLEQIKNDVAYSDNPVTLVGISAGVSYGALGSAHHSLHDLAVLRAVNNVDIIVPADNVETRWAVQAAANAEHPVYLRFGKAPLYDVHEPTRRYAPGKAITLRKGGDIAFIATGETVVHALLAAAELAEQARISSTVVSVPSIRPLDVDTIMHAAGCGTVITVEEHMVHGGLGEACAHVLLEAGIPVRFKIVEFPTSTP